MMRSQLTGLLIFFCGLCGCGGGELPSSAMQQTQPVLSGQLVTPAEVISRGLVDIKINSTGICSGVLIDPWIVLTAGHCGISVNQPKREVSLDPLAGEITVSIPGVGSKPVASIHKLGREDLALLMLKNQGQVWSAVRYLDSIQPAVEANKVRCYGRGPDGFYRHAEYIISTVSGQGVVSLNGDVAGGDSGGPCLDASNRLVMVMTSHLSGTTFGIGRGFAVKPVLEALRGLIFNQRSVSVLPTGNPSIFIQPNGRAEVFVPAVGRLPSGATTQGIAHIGFDQHFPYTQVGGPWMFATNKSYLDAAGIYSSLQTFDVIARSASNELHHYTAVPGQSWTGGGRIGSGNIIATGRPAFLDVNLRTSDCWDGGFQVVSPRLGGGLMNLKKTNCTQSYGWLWGQIAVFGGSATYFDAAMIQNSNGNLEVIATRAKPTGGREIAHFWRTLRTGWQETKTFTVESGSGAPAFVQLPSREPGQPHGLVYIIVPRPGRGLKIWTNKPPYSANTWVEDTTNPLGSVGIPDAPTLSVMAVSRRYNATGSNGNLAILRWQMKEGIANELIYSWQDVSFFQPAPAPTPPWTGPFRMTRWP